MALDTAKIDRISVIALCGVMIAIVVIGLLQFRSHLFATEDNVFKPFREDFSKRLQEEEGAPDAVAASAEAGDLVTLQQQDTDQDGLNDFQEQYVYITSPYLADSDSDGLRDSDEITKGSNPNCPEGTECAQQRAGGTGTEADAASVFSDLAPSTASLVPTTADGEVDTATLREMLRESGVPQDVLDQTDDTTLAQLAQEVAGQSERGANAFTNVQSEAERIKNLSIEEKRQLLIDAGADPADVAQLDDETLNLIINQATDVAQQQVLEEGVPEEE